MKKKILHILVKPTLAGAQRISLEILKSLDDTKYDKYVIFSNGQDDNEKKVLDFTFKAAGIHVFYFDNLVRELNLKKDILVIRDIYKFCKKYKFDIVHTNSSKPGVVGRIAATLARVPFVIHTVHGVSFTKFTPCVVYIAYYLFEMFASFFCKKIVLVNNYYKKFYKLFKNKVITIYNGMDFTKFTCEKSRREDDIINLLFVGRLDKQKDPMTILKAFSILIERKIKVRLTLVGSGEYYDACKKFVDENRLNSFVYLPGWQTNTEKYYANSDIFVSSSIYEAFGLMYLEASYSYLPIIATNVEGTPEVVLDNQTGLLYSPRDYKKLASLIEELVLDKEKCHRLGINGHNYVTRMFNIDSMTNKYIDLYENYDKKKEKNN